MPPSGTGPAWACAAPPCRQRCWTPPRSQGWRWCLRARRTYARTLTGVSVDGRRARYLAVADGLHSPIRRRLGLERAADSTTAPRWGTRRHFAVAPWTDLVEVHWASRSEAYVTPVGPELVGIAVLSSVQAPFDQQLAAFPALRDRLPDTGVTAVR